jgi:NAD(P)-dependent dehydrogenase (short-subunit alcohol dehydrogenase family)
LDTEIANVALFLASGARSLFEAEEVLIKFEVDDSSYVNGQIFAVDGGLSASLPVVPGKLS